MTKYYPSLLMHELELVDLFGAIVKDLPDVPSYPLPDGWPKATTPCASWNPAYFDHKTMTYNPPAKEVRRMKAMSDNRQQNCNSIRSSTSCAERTRLLQLTLEGEKVVNAVIAWV